MRPRAAASQVCGAVTSQCGGLLRPRQVQGTLAFTATPPLQCHLFLGTSLPHVGERPWDMKSPAQRAGRDLGGGALSTGSSFGEGQVPPWHGGHAAGVQGTRCSQAGCKRPSGVQTEAAWFLVLRAAAARQPLSPELQLGGLRPDCVLGGRQRGHLPMSLHSLPPCAPAQTVLQVNQLEGAGRGFLWLF